MSNSDAMSQRYDEGLTPEDAVVDLVRHSIAMGLGYGHRYGYGHGYGNAADVLRVTMDVNAANHFSSNSAEPSSDGPVHQTRRQ